MIFILVTLRTTFFPKKTESFWLSKKKKSPANIKKTQITAPK